MQETDMQKELNFSGGTISRLRNLITGYPILTWIQNAITLIFQQLLFPILHLHITSLSSPSILFMRLRVSLGLRTHTLRADLIIIPTRRNSITERLLTIPT